MLDLSRCGSHCPGTTGSNPVAPAIYRGVVQRKNAWFEIKRRIKCRGLDKVAVRLMIAQSDRASVLITEGSGFEPRSSLKARRGGYPRRAVRIGLSKTQTTLKHAPFLDCRTFPFPSVAASLAAADLRLFLEARHGARIVLWSLVRAQQYQASFQQLREASGLNHALGLFGKLPDQ